jgi:hypothetical protein
MRWKDLKQRRPRPAPAPPDPDPTAWCGWLRWWGTEWQMVCTGVTDVVAWMILCETPVPPGAWCVDRRVLPRGRAPWEGTT